MDARFLKFEVSLLLLLRLYTDKTFIHVYPDSTLTTSNLKIRIFFNAL